MASGPWTPGEGSLPDWSTERRAILLSPVEQLLRKAGNCRGLLAHSQDAKQEPETDGAEASLSWFASSPQGCPVLNPRHTGFWESPATWTLPLPVTRHGTCECPVRGLGSQSSPGHPSVQHTTETWSFHNSLLPHLANKSCQHLNHRQVGSASVLTGVKRDSLYPQETDKRQKKLGLLDNSSQISGYFFFFFGHPVFGSKLKEEREGEGPGKHQPSLLKALLPEGQHYILSLPLVTDTRRHKAPVNLSSGLWSGTGSVKKQKSALHLHSDCQLIREFSEWPLFVSLNSAVSTEPQVSAASDNCGLTSHSSPGHTAFRSLDPFHLVALPFPRTLRCLTGS